MAGVEGSSGLHDRPGGSVLWPEAKTERGAESS